MSGQTIPAVGDTVTIRLTNPRSDWENSIDGRTCRVTHVCEPVTDHSHPIGVDDGMPGTVWFRLHEVESPRS